MNNNFVKNSYQNNFFHKFNRYFCIKFKHIFSCKKYTDITPSDKI